jgi:hypothetical protein
MAWLFEPMSRRGEPMRLVLRTTNVVADWSPSGRDVPGKTLVFSDKVTWVSVANQNVSGPAGSHSGTNRVVRVAAANDGVYPLNVVVQEHEATWVLNAVTAPGTQLDRGQVTVRGVLFNRHSPPLPPELQEQRFAITGGTGPYARARGYIIEAENDRTLEIDL